MSRTGARTVAAARATTGALGGARATGRCSKLAHEVLALSAACAGTVLGPCPPSGPPAGPPPAQHNAVVLPLSAAPGALRAGSGTVRVTEEVADATTCQLRLLPSRPPPVLYPRDPAHACKGGSYSAQVTAGANRGPVERTVASALSASNASSASPGVPHLLLASRATPPVPTTTAAPSAPARMRASTAPPSTSPVPGTPPSAAPPMKATTTTPLAPPGKYYNPNWAGYVTTGGPFRAVTGTFTVPSAGTAATCSESFAEWVGLDGFGTGSVIQAGVGEDMTNPVTGACTPGTFYASAWSQLWPAPPEPVPVPVHTGDQVTVSIWQLNGPAWAMTFTDRTDGQSSSTDLSYTGPASSAEWVVEAPTNAQLCGTGVDPTAWEGICQLAAYDPPVSFSALHMTGDASQMVDVVIVQSGEQVAAPSRLSGSGFAVAYGPAGG